MQVPAKNYRAITRLPLFLCHFAELRKLQLDDVTLDRSFFVPLIPLTKLDTLVVMRGTITSPRFEGSMSSIRTLHLEKISRSGYLLPLFPDVTAFRTRYFRTAMAQHLQGVTWLSFDFFFKKPGILPLPRWKRRLADVCLPHLVTLAVTNPTPPDALFAEVQVPNLRKAVFSGVTSFPLEGVAALKHLHVLDITFGRYSCALSNQCLFDLKQLKHLTLDCSGCEDGVSVGGESSIRALLPDTSVFVKRHGVVYL